MTLSLVSNRDVFQVVKVEGMGVPTWVIFKNGPLFGLVQVLAHRKMWFAGPHGEPMDEAVALDVLARAS